MRPPTWARWATCGLALSICLPAAADAPKKKIAVESCLETSSKDSALDPAVELSLTNNCPAHLDCTLSWKVVCAPKSAKKRAAHDFSVKLALEISATKTTTASAASCGDQEWSIESIAWTCTSADGE